MKDHLNIILISSFTSAGALWQKGPILISLFHEFFPEKKLNIAFDKKET
jgi:hypothetical protein